MRDRERCGGTDGKGTWEAETTSNDEATKIRHQELHQRPIARYPGATYFREDHIYDRGHDMRQRPSVCEVEGFQMKVNRAIGKPLPTDIQPQKAESRGHY